MQLIQNTLTGGGALPQVYKQVITVSEMSTNGITPVNTWIMEGSWPKKITGMKYNRMSSDNVIEEVEFEVDTFYKL